MRELTNKMKMFIIQQHIDLIEATELPSKRIGVLSEGVEIRNNYIKEILKRELKRLERDTSIQIPIIKTSNNIEQQLNKINSEREECLQEYFNYQFFKTQGYETSAIKFEEQMQLEALDILTATLNLVEMLNIPQEVLDEHKAKMKRYETEKNYTIKNGSKL